MIFTVTYRGADGDVRTESVEAAGRGDCFAQMKARGIVPMGVKEGSSGSRRERGASAKRNGRNKGGGIGNGVWRNAVVLVVLVALAGGALWWWLLGHEVVVPDDGPKKPSSFAKEVKPAVAPKPLPATNEPPKYVPTPLPADWKDMTKAERAEWRKEDAKRNPPPPKPVPTMFSASSLRRKKDAPPPTFNNQIHADLACYLQAGRDIPPPSRITDAEALAAADMKIKYYDSDSDAVLEEKKAVEEMLVEMKEYIQQGGHANDYFQKLAQRQEMEAEAVSETRRNVRSLIKEGRMEDAKAALEAYNAYLKEKGVPPVRIKGLK